MKKILLSMTLFIMSIFGLFLTPFSFVYADTGEFPEYIEITDYKYSTINTSKKDVGPFTKDVNGNAMYLFNLPFELAENNEIFEIEMSYKSCSKWFMGITGLWCTTDRYQVGVEVENDVDVVYYLEDDYTGLFDYNENPIKEIGEVSTLVDMSESLGSLAITTSDLDGTPTNYYFAYRSTSVGTSTISNYNDLTKYDYYFILPQDYTWENVIIRVRIGDVLTGEYEDIVCGENGEGCYVGGAPIPPSTPNVLVKFEAFIDKLNSLISNDFITYLIWGIGGFLILSLINKVFGVLKFLTSIPGAIGKIINFIIVSFKWLFMTLKKLIKFKFKLIKWIVTNIWITLGLILKVIASIYVKINELFARAAETRKLRNRGG